MIQRLLLYIFLFIFSQICFAQKTDAPAPALIPKYNLSLIAPEALSQFDYVNYPRKDKWGFIWFVSSHGLHCYDGKAVLTYNNKGSQHFLGLTTEGTGYQHLAISNGNILWAVELGTGAIIKIDARSKKIIKRIQYKKERSEINVIISKTEEDQIYSVYEDYSTNEIFLHCLSCKESTPQLIDKGIKLTDYRIYQGHHWVNFKNGVIRYSLDGKTKKKIPLGSNLYFNNRNKKMLTISHLSKKKYFSLGLEDSDLTEINIPAYIPPRFNHFTETRNEVWYSNSNLDVYLHDLETNTVFDYSNMVNQLIMENTPSSLADSFSDIELTKNGELLFAFKNGILKFTLNPETNKKHLESISSGRELTSMREIAEDEEGNLYASYYSGVGVKLKGANKFEDFRDTREKDDKNSRTYGLTVWKDKLIWNNVVFDLHSNKKEMFNSEYAGLHFTHYLEEDTLWAYEWLHNALIAYDLNKETSRVIKERILVNAEYVSSLILDKKTNLFWISTYTYGIQALNKKGEIVESYPFSYFGLPQKKQRVFEMKMTGDTIWFGTEIGLGIFNKKTKKAQILETKAADVNGKYQFNSVFSILDLSKDFFYLGTERGLSRFDKTKGQFDYLPANHPLAKVEFNRGSKFKASDGRYYFGSINGLYSFFPEELKFEQQGGLDFLEFSYLSIYNPNDNKTRIIDKDLNSITTLDLNHSDRNVKIGFSSPNQDKVFYSYNIPGILEGWSSYSLDNFFEAASFPVGSYELEIRATKTPNLNNENTKRLKLSIYKPEIWYKKSWMIVLYFLAGIGVTFLVFRYRDQQKLARRREVELLRTKISSDLHDDVGSILAGIAMRTEVMSMGKSSEEQKPLSALAVMSREAMEGMRDIVWAMDSRKDKYKNLIARMRNFASQSLEETTIEHQFQLTNIDPNKFLNPKARQQLYLIFKEAISNVLKHSNATEVLITLEQTKTYFSLSIKDNGNLLKNNQSDGLGLSNMHARAKDIGGVLTVDITNGYQIKVKIDI